MLQRSWLKFFEFVPGGVYTSTYAFDAFRRSRPVNSIHPPSKADATAAHSDDDRFDEA